MDIRKTINEQPALAATIGGFVCVIGFALLGWQIFGGRTSAQLSFAGKAFFSDDDGKTWFVDDESNIPPFDHNGKQAYRAAVFRCGKGKPFVAYLKNIALVSWRELAELQKTAADRSPNRPPPKFLSSTYQLDVKKPGGAPWIAAPSPGQNFDAAAYQKATRPVCPDGSANVTQVQPYDSDAR